MHLSDHDLIQLSEQDLLELPEEGLRRLSVKLLNDLKEARERLRQNSSNSSRPPSTDAPWKETPGGLDAEKAPDDKASADKNRAAEEDVDSNPKNAKNTQPEKAAPDERARNPGKQPGATGFGRSQTLTVTAEEHHYPGLCRCCESPLDTQAASAYTAFETIDLEWAQAGHPGLRLTNTRHTFYQARCGCGHCTRLSPWREAVDGTAVEISEWRLVGPGLAALIVCLALRMRLSRARIQEFLADWLGLQLSIGTINATLHEAGACALPVEDELLAAIAASALVHVDETAWWEAKDLLWLWVFCNQQFVVYWIAYRSAELIDNVLIDYQGRLMTDGYGVYRHFNQRLRCWAHLCRKAQGLAEGLDPEARLFGERVSAVFKLLARAVYAARERPPGAPLPIIYQALLGQFWQECERMACSPHDKSRRLAKELLNDWEAIFQVLLYPHLPLTNNEAERALRHWVILRKISHGTRSEDGSRLLAILISVIETCRKQKQSPWFYLASVIRQRRLGLPIPKLFGVRGTE